MGSGDRGDSRWRPRGAPKEGRRMEGGDQEPGIGEGWDRASVSNLVESS